MSIQNSQTLHRINIINEWNIVPASKVLEIGCGQGDCTSVLATAVGHDGHVDAIDPAPLDYGSPWTLGEAQAYLSKSDVGQRITWHQASPLEFLDSVKEDEYDVAVLVHSAWYFASPTQLKETLSKLRGKAKSLCIAEYALSATELEAVPHLLAALTRASLESHKEDSDANIRTAISPNGIQRISEESGWKLVSDKRIVPDEELGDGGWEVGTVLGEGFLAEADEVVADEKIKIVLESMRQAVKYAVRRLEGKKVRTMDVWVARFE